MENKNIIPTYLLRHPEFKEVKKTLLKCVREKKHCRRCGDEITFLHYHLLFHEAFTLSELVERWKKENIYCSHCQWLRDWKNIYDTLVAEGRKAPYPKKMTDPSEILDFVSNEEKKLK